MGIVEGSHLILPLPEVACWVSHIGYPFVLAYFGHLVLLPTNAHSDHIHIK